MDIATQVGQGLAEAHGAGIVHRDIKPANLLIAKGGVVKILDFGLAKLAGTEGVTQTGTTVGTVAYMSPEQARGQEVDQRTDIWSLGVVLYEMIAGQQPFRGENLLALSGAIQGQPPATLTGQSSSLNGVIGRTLHKGREQRYQLVTDLLGELRKATASATRATSQPDVPSIAVLPFADMSPAKDQDYFCEGLAEELIDALARLEGLRVVARTSAFRFKGDAPDLREVGQKLNVKTVLEGCVRKAGNRLRINAQLINTEDGYHLWSERYDRDMDDVFAVQDEIARSVVEKLKVKLLGAADTPLVKRPTANVEAYNLVLQGRYFTVRATGPETEKSLECFTQALALEPAYAQAHAGIAINHAVRSIISHGSPSQLMPAAKEASRKALAIDDTVVDAHTALAFVLQFYEWDWPGAEREYRRALDLNPGDTFARTHYALLLGQLGKADASIAEARHAVVSDPLSVLSRHMLAMNLVLARRFDQALVETRAGLELDSYQPLYWDLCWALVGLGRSDEAVEEGRKATLAPGDLIAQAWLGWTLGLAGQRQEALTIFEDLERRRQDYVGGSLLASVCVGLGDHEQAISWLPHAAEERDGFMTFLNTLLVFDPLRSDPRFQALLQKMNFPAAKAD